jgi:beta-lactam-binding protein with PASTA domain
MTTIGELPARVDDAARARLLSFAGMLDLQVQPSIAAGRRRVRFSAVVTNTGASAVQTQLSVGGGDGAVVASIVPAVLVLDPGQTRTVDVTLRPRRPRVAGAEVSRTLTIRARGDHTASPPAARDVVFVQQRLVPAWTLALGTLLVAAAVVAATQLPDRTTVPGVVGAPDVATAERTLKAAGLQLDPQVRSSTSTDARPGTVLDQIPDAGRHASRGDRVTLLVAIGAGRAVTPALSGQTPARATALLQAAGLTAGPLLPTPAPARAVVASQLPAAGTRVPAGTAVTLIVRAATAADAGAVADNAPSGRATVPAFDDGESVNAYLRGLASAGLVPRVVRTTSPQPLGTVLGVTPRPGLELAAGDRVRVNVAAGVPDLTFDTGKVVRIFDLTDGRSAREASPPQGSAVEPSWSPDGRRLMYRVGRRLLLVSARLADSGRVLYDGTTRYAAATFAPAPAGDVIALVRRSGGDGDLCFARIGQSKLHPRCAADPKWDLGRQISWRAGGRELLVFGVRRGKPGTFGMLRYRSSVPFSTNPRDWRATVATDTSVSGRGVIGAAYSPSGTRVALVTNVGLPRFQLRLTTPGELRRPSAPSLPVRACEVAWRPDGGELAVVQSDGTCSRPLGQIVRLKPGAPRSTTSVSSGGRHPSYQPLTYAGPKGVS